MRSLYILALYPLWATLMLHIAMAKPPPNHAMVVPPADTKPTPIIPPKKRALVHGLPPGWSGVFQTVTSIQPPLISPIFVQFFDVAARLAAADPIPGRHVQRIPFGSLVLEFIAHGDQNQIVTKEFVTAASLWLRDAAEKGWTGFFKAWVVDKTDGEMVFVRLGTVWDELLSLTS